MKTQQQKTVSQHREHSRSIFRRIMFQLLTLMFFCISNALWSSCRYAVPNKEMESKTKKDTVITLDSTSDSREICRVDSIPWTPGSSESILLDPLMNVFPGAVLSAESFETGKYILLDDDKRKPITFSLQGPIFKKSAMAVNVMPKLAQVDDAINKILKDSVVGLPPAKLVIEAHEVYSRSHLNLMFKGEYSGGIGRIEGGFNFDDKTVKARYLLDVTQIYYTVNVNNPTSTGFFKSKPQGIGDFSPVYVSQVKYGRRIMIAIESKSNIQGREAELKAEFGLFAKSKVKSSLIDSTINKENSLKVLIMGGNADVAFATIKAVGNSDSLYAAIARGANWSLSNQAIPLAYTLQYTHNGAVFNISKTGSYVARRCVIKPVHEFILNNITKSNICPQEPYGGDDREFAGDPHFTSSINLTWEGNTIIAEVYGHWQEDNGNTSGTIPNQRFVIATVPDSLDILDITSYKSFSLSDIRTAGYGNYEIPLTVNEKNSCVRAMTVIGDSPLSDDMYPNGCVDDIHTKIKKISFYPIKLSVTKRVIKK
ncbi:hypothetical protein GWR56_13575 [Mucilaginibacter sp. 14171R-50]|uniref:thiol-activated cytolysin family protein n=1 Tax=Mucilaginibacter sp. 14171R-50 TaxID=2703789 RepID=UPI00138C9DB0|nr:thiol-activated cytolysin family protein [Mucilaginibacter sp. 14171R-50]QHS56518.1 hypothetical protein GWR56_13575 [Mucilaginibacter sp. 14171R-50]